VLPQRPNGAALPMVTMAGQKRQPSRFLYLPPSPTPFATVSLLLNNAVLVL
jgi:hypothetical protein